jgi:hypothetical protein
MTKYLIVVFLPLGSMWLSNLILNIDFIEINKSTAYMLSQQFIGIIFKLHFIAKDL